MSSSPDHELLLIEQTIHSIAADFLSSFSDLLRAAALLERRPKLPLENPDIDSSIRKAKWLLSAAIEASDRLAGGSSAAAVSTTTTQPTSRRSLSSIIAGAVQQGMLTESSQARDLVSRLAESHDPNQLILAFAAELKACRRALDGLETKSNNLALQLHATLSAYVNGLVNGQYIAIMKSAKQSK